MRHSRFCGCWPRTTAGASRRLIRTLARRRFIVTLIPSRLLQTNKYNKVKFEPYECGIEPRTDARDRYSIRYYLVAMLFVIFDVETVFMFPWAVVLERLGIFGLIEMVVFLFILVVGFIYAWKKGALEWA